MDLPWWQIWMDRSMPMVLEKMRSLRRAQTDARWNGRSVIPAALCAGLSLCLLTCARAEKSVARIWNEENLKAIRLSFPDPPVHARNLFHVSVAMWDAWCAFDEKSVGYVHRERGVIPEGSSLKAARHQALSYAAYRTLTHRYSTVKHPETSIENARAAQRGFVARMREFGYPIEWMQEDEQDLSPAALGNRIARSVRTFFQQDGSHENDGYADASYRSVNAPLVLAQGGNLMDDPTRWQPLEFEVAFSQTGQPLDFNTQFFIGSHWGSVWPFAIDWPIDESQYQGIHLSAFISGKVDDAFKEALVDVIAMGAQLDPDAAPMVDMAPSNQGNHSLGAQDGKGHHTNPFTGEPYLPQWVNHADYARVIAEYWADGPDSETPPGHWNVLANEVVDHPEFERKFMGKGEPLSPLEWDVRMYFLLNGAVHDAAVAAWGLKRQFDTSRPVSAIRHLGQLGQCTDPSLGSYHPLGLPLVEGLIMLVTEETVAADGMHAHLGASSIGQLAVKAWRARAMEMDSKPAGVGWILAQNWMPYQQPTFVTPAFAGFVSGHSTFSRAAAEILTRVTGSEFFPGGLMEHPIEPGWLEFEQGPSQPMVIQWATYFDAADEAGRSRLYGGIHIPADDFAGRKVGAYCGQAVWDLGVKYVDGRVIPNRLPISLHWKGDGHYEARWPQRRGLFYGVGRRSSLNKSDPLVSSINFYRATDKQGSWAFDVGSGAEAKGFLMVIESLSDGLFLNPD